MIVRWSREDDKSVPEVSGRFNPGYVVRTIYGGTEADVATPSIIINAASSCRTMKY